MTSWHEYYLKTGQVPDWPYPCRYDQEQQIESDILIVGGGIAGCWAAISVARLGLSVVMAEKGDVIRSGQGGPGVDHWCNAPAYPKSNVDPDDWARRLAGHPYANAIGTQIQCREDYDTLLEMEQIGGKIRDTNDEYVGAIGRDPESKFMISPRYTRTPGYDPDPTLTENPVFDPNRVRNNVVFRVWGSTFKPALKNECKRLGVKVLDRVMMTGLLNEKGIQGARVVGATGFNNRTGEFMIFKAKATILATAGAGSMWMINTELAGYSNMQSRNQTGNGSVMAWRAGAALTNMEASGGLRIATGHKHKWYTGAGDASYENVPIVDANGRRVPVPIQGWADGGAMSGRPGIEAKLIDKIKNGELALPFYGDFPGMADVERRATWQLMLREESTTQIMVDSFNAAGFNIARDQLQSYKMIEASSPAQWRDATHGGGVLIDWNLKSSLDGLYAAGEQLFRPDDHSYCAATGRYAGRKAADYVKQIGQGQISREQIEREKARVYAPTQRNVGMDWKELHAGIARAMQYYCSEHKSETLFNIGLDTLNKIEKDSVPLLYATDPHKLMRVLEDSSLLTYAQLIFQASNARKAGAAALDFRREDYPVMDPPEWNKFITIKQENGKTVTGFLPMNYFGDMKQQYEAHNRDYSGVYKGK
jgi:succinate dehydrogenase/fumarate reductase flavoprotein subunit